jgi:hypothetical protein
MGEKLKDIAGKVGIALTSSLIIMGIKAAFGIP